MLIVAARKAQRVEHIGGNRQQRAVDRPDRLDLGWRHVGAVRQADDDAGGAAATERDRNAAADVVGRRIDIPVVEKAIQWHIQRHLHVTGHCFRLDTQRQVRAVDNFVDSFRQSDLSSTVEQPGLTDRRNFSQ
jgi:hypothetical protein